MLKIEFLNHKNLRVNEIIILNRALFYHIYLSRILTSKQEQTGVINLKTVLIWITFFLKWICSNCRHKKVEPFWNYIGQLDEITVKQLHCRFCLVNGSSFGHWFCNENNSLRPGFKNEGNGQLSILRSKVNLEWLTIIEGWVNTPLFSHLHSVSDVDGAKRL